jgi:two-component system chemotaxis response regulator CheY
MEEDGLHFLIVDDDAESRATIVEYLRSMGVHRISLAHDGTEAIRLLERDASITFIISDWEMPMMNGLSLLQRVKQNPSRSHIPFLVMTSPISMETEKVILAAENMVDGYLIKPFRSAVLKEKIDRILTISSLGDQKQVVVVDDDEDAREMVVEYLKLIGFKEVLPFPGGAAALQYLNKFAEKVGLIVSDWEMPTVSGIDLLRAVKSHPKLKNVSFLMVTSQSSIERMKVMQAARSNVDEYLLKPFNLDDFKARILKVVHSSKTASEVMGLVAEGNKFLESGNFQYAYNKFEKALKLQPENEFALRGMADATAKVKGFQAAVPYFRKALEMNPLHADTYLKLVVVYERIGWIDKAIALLESAIQHVGFHAELHFNLGKMYNKNRMLDEAIRELEKTLEIQLDHPEAKLMLRALLIQKKGLSE